MSDPRKPVIIFGTSTLSKLAKHLLEHDQRREVAALTLNADYVDGDTCLGLPLVAFESIRARFPPERYEMLIPLGHRAMHAFRMERCEQAIRMGYTLTHLVSSSAQVAVGTEIRENVLIYESAIVQPFVRLGWNVTVRAGANIGHDSVVGDHTFIASGVVIGGNVTIGERCWLGLGAVLRNGIRIADRSFIGAGAVVVADTESDGVYVGNPARRLPGKTALEVTSGPSTG